MERKVNKWIGAESAVIRTLHRSVVVKGDRCETKGKTLHLPANLCSLTNGDEIWVGL